MRDLTPYTTTTISPDLERRIDLTAKQYTSVDVRTETDDPKCEWCGLAGTHAIHITYLCDSCWEWVMNERTVMA